MNILKNIILKLSRGGIKNSEDLAVVKRQMAKRYRLPCPNNISLLKTYHEMIKNKSTKPSEIIKNLLITRPVRSLSGIVNISVLTKPYPCPGKCLYCPIEKGIPKSYISGEPAVERAKKLNYDPYLQVKRRVEMLEAEGHQTDKIELRVVGGTWSYYLKQYQNWFIKKCFDAANEKVSTNLREAQKFNEGAEHKIVGLSIETRPDFITESEIKRLRQLGATMAELGAQSIYDDVLKLNLRGHEVKETVLATKLLKDAGFKVLYQMMPNLLGSDLKKDKKMFEELFQNPDFQPDYLKIYPCAILKEAPLYKLWKTGKYKPYTRVQLINLIKLIKKKVPYYIRIQRIARDIPSQKILEGGAKISNLHQIIANESKKEGWRCRCIRCREVKGKYNPKEKVYLFRQDYLAAGGKEIFLSLENRKRTKLHSLLRLRITSDNRAIVREIHTYGFQLPIKNEDSSSIISPQHKGLGKKLMKEAEKITKKESNFKKIAVIASVGARPYFRGLGYELENTYMVKSL